MKSIVSKRLSDHPVIVIIGVIAAFATIISTCLALFIFGTGIEFLVDRFQDEKPTPTRVAILDAGSTALVTDLPSLPTLSPTDAIVSTEVVIPAETSAERPPQDYRDEGFGYHHSGQYYEAISLFDSCVELYPSYGDCYHGLGMAYREIGDFAESLKNHDRAIALNPIRFDLYWERGVTYLRMTSYDEAIADFMTCIEKNEAFGNCYNGLGMAYRDKGSFTQALSNHNKAIELSPNSADFYWERGVTYQRMGESEQADVDFARARELGYDQ